MKRGQKKKKLPLKKKKKKESCICGDAERGERIADSIRDRNLAKRSKMVALNLKQPSPEGDL